MKCPNCGHPKLARNTRDMPYTYKGETTYIKNVKGDYCPNCGEAVLEMGESLRTSEEMLNWNKEVNASLIDPAFIARARKKLRLDQKQAAVLFGGGVNAFSRYETGKTKPPLALVNLLKLLDAHPELLSEVAEGRCHHAAA